ncbi:MAG: hypothetical protein LUQ11_13510 [Methylococcaceae bacterium]|nr:hypothetical protein [Methylococcaceae bacterium]
MTIAVFAELFWCHDHAIQLSTSLITWARRCTPNPALLKPNSPASWLQALELHVMHMHVSRTLGPAKLQIFTQMKSQISFSDFCPPAGTIEFRANEGFLTNSIMLFKLSYPDYELEASVHDGMVFVRRNGLHQHSEQYSGKDPCHVAIQWDVESIACGVMPSGNPADSVNQHMRAVHTPITLPPPELVRILRTENLLVNSAYHSTDDLFSCVLDCLHLCDG